MVDEIQELKEDRRRESQSFETKLRTLEIEKAEMSAKEQSTRENMA